MATGIFRTPHDWAEVDFGVETMAITRRDYEAGRYQPPFDELPLEADYRAAQKRAAMAKLPRDLAQPVPESPSGRGPLLRDD
jgi:hypothetical protein